MVIKSSDESEEEAALDAAAEEEMLKQESFVRTYSKLAYESDLSKKPASSYLLINRSMGIEDNVKAAFQHFMEENPDVFESFTDEEKKKFEHRVVIQILKDMKQASTTPETVGDAEWQAGFGESLEDQKPSVTRKAVEQRNGEHADGQLSKFEAWRTCRSSSSIKGKG